MAKRLIGLDIGSWSVKALYTDAKDPSIVGWDTEQIVYPDVRDETAPTNVAVSPPPEAGEIQVDRDEQMDPWASAAATLLERIAGGEDSVAVNLPGTHAVTLHIEVPFAERSKAASVLPHLMTDRLPVPISEVVWDFQIQKRDDTYEAIVGFARKSAVSHFLEQSTLAGYDPARVLVPENALAISLRTSGLTAGAAVLDIGHEHARMVVIDDERIVMSRTIKVAGKSITESIAKMFQLPLNEAERVKHHYAAIVSAAEAPNDQMRLMSDAIVSVTRNLVREVRRSLQGLYAKDRIEVPTLYITGGSASIKGLDTYLEVELGLPVRHLKASTQHSAMAVGLLAAQNDKQSSHVLNLRQGEFAYRGKSAYVRRQLAIFATASVLLLGTLFVVLLLQKLSYEARRDAMRQTLQSQTQALFGQNLTKKKDIERVIGGGDATVTSFVPKISAFELMHLVTTKISPDIELKLERFEVDIDRKVIQIMGETTDAQAVDRIVSDLETIECLKSIKKDKLRVKADGKADFELQISAECS